jgi:hypothetical protein
MFAEAKPATAVIFATPARFPVTTPSVIETVAIVVSLEYQLTLLPLKPASSLPDASLTTAAKVSLALATIATEPGEMVIEAGTLNIELVAVKLEGSMPPFESLPEQAASANTRIGATNLRDVYTDRSPNTPFGNPTSMTCGLFHTW